MSRICYRQTIVVVYGDDGNDVVSNGVDDDDAVDVGVVADAESDVDG